MLLQKYKTFETLSKRIGNETSGQVWCWGVCHGHTVIGATLTCLDGETNTYIWANYSLHRSSSQNSWGKPFSVWDPLLFRWHAKMLATRIGEKVVMMWWWGNHNFHLSSCPHALSASWLVFVAGWGTKTSFHERTSSLFYQNWAYDCTESTWKIPLSEITTSQPDSSC